MCKKLPKLYVKVEVKICYTVGESFDLRFAHYFTDCQKTFNVDHTQEKDHFHLVVAL